MSGANGSASPDADPDEAVAYWTEDRQRNALPAEPPGAELARDLPDRGEIDPSASPSTTEASEGPSGSAAASPETPDAFATLYVTQPALYPHRTIGRLFYSLNGRDMHASAAVVNRNGILTAAHCVRSHETGAWATNVTFAPAYENGQPNRGFGTWGIGNMWVRDEWLGPPVDLSFDFSFCQVPARQGQAIGDLVGWLGIVINRPNLRWWEDVGYPSRPIPGYPFDGSQMWRCFGDFSQAVGLTIRKDGNLTQGASGGPWVVQGDDGFYYANGTYSQFYNDPPTENTTPYFRDVVMDLYRRALG